MLLAPPHKTTSAIFTHVSWHPYTMDWKPKPQSLLAVRAEISLGTSTSNWHALPSMQHLKNYLLGYVRGYSSRTDNEKKAQGKVREVGMGASVPSWHIPVPVLSFVHQPEALISLHLWKKVLQNNGIHFNSRIFVNQILERIMSFDAMGSFGRSFNLLLKTWQI